MREDEVRTLADSILRPILGPVGFISSDVEARRDHDGDDSLYVIVHFGSGSAVASGKIYSDAHLAMHDALVACGEQRFPYFKYDYPDDDPYLEDDGDDESP